LQPRTLTDGLPGPGEIPRLPPVSAPWADRERAFAISAAIHVVLLAALAFLLPLPALVPPPPVESLSVELLSEKEIAALTKPELPPEEPVPAPAPVIPVPLNPAIPEEAPPAPTPEEPPLALAHAAKLFSDTALNWSARKALATLAVGARFEQLCDVEALEQIARGKPELRPERAVAYATADTKVAGNVLIADGAAFLSQGQWYRLSFRCETTPDHSKVVSFDFATGGPIGEGRGLGDGSADD
jgi:Domain of Unknown Function (DUF930)